MLTCIARSKRAGDESSGQTDDSDSKQAKSLSSQVKLTHSPSLSAPPPLLIEGIFVNSFSAQGYGSESFRCLPALYAVYGGASAGTDQEHSGDDKV